MGNKHTKNLEKQATPHSFPKKKKKKKHKQTQNKSRGRNVKGEAMSVLQYEKGEENRTTSEAIGGGDKAWGGSSMAYWE